MMKMVLKREMVMVMVMTTMMKMLVMMMVMTMVKSGKKVNNGRIRFLHTDNTASGYNADRKQKQK